jgi:methylated-DNA-protein-cysteine methyltransferase-like protein
MPTDRPKGPNSAYRQDVLAVLRSLEAGEVVSYGEVASESGHPGTGRGVGQILAHAPEPLAWWRVVRSTGQLAPHKVDEQARRLAAEGVVVIDGRVRMGRR